MAHDAYFYWVHRLMHDPRWFRRTHRRHHKSYNPSPFTAYSFDVSEALLMLAFSVIYPLVFPMHWEAMQWIMLHQIVRNTFQHCGYELMPARADGRPGWTSSPPPPTTTCTTPRPAGTTPPGSPGGTAGWAPSTRSTSSALLR